MHKEPRHKVKIRARMLALAERDDVGESGDEGDEEDEGDGEDDEDEGEEAGEEDTSNSNAMPVLFGGYGYLVSFLAGIFTVIM